MYSGHGETLKSANSSTNNEILSSSPHREIVSQVLTLNPIKLTSSTFAQTLSHFKISVPPLPTVNDAMPTSCAVLLLDFTTLNLFHPIDSQQNTYCTELVIVEIVRSSWFYYDYICNDKESRTGDFHFLLQVFLFVPHYH